MSIRECVRCSAATKKGIRCKNRTCIYSEFCAAHTKAIFDLALKPSAIPGAGTGLFTLKPIKKNTNIAEYSGDILTQASYDATDSGYGVAISRGRIMDAASTQSDLGRYANHCRSANKRAGHCKGNNARFSVSNRNGSTIINLKATKNILPGSEIFVSYGASYWK
jgi:SET domain-containing protein